MCCDWFDVLVGVAGGFFLGCTVMALLARKIVQEQAADQMNIHARTELKNQHLGEWK